MKEKGVFKRAPGGFVPDDDRAVAIMASVPEGGKVLMWVHKPRYPEHHRFAFAVLQKIATAIGKPVDVVLLWLKYETGRFDWLKLPDGRTVENPHSVAFESMDQADFQNFWKEAMPVIIEKVLPNIDQATYEEIRDMIAGKVS